MIKKRYIIWVVLVVTVIVAVVGISIYQKINKPNVKIDGEYSYIFIPTGSNYTTLLNIIEDKNILIDKESFTWVAKKKKLENHVHAGRFKIKNGLSNNQLANLLRSGRQEEINLVFNNIRTKEQLAGRIGNQLEAVECLVELIVDVLQCNKWGYTPLDYTQREDTIAVIRSVTRSLGLLIPLNNRWSVLSSFQCNGSCTITISS